MDRPLREVADGWIQCYRGRGGGDGIGNKFPPKFKNFTKPRKYSDYHMNETFTLPEVLEREEYWEGERIDGWMEKIWSDSMPTGGICLRCLSQSTVSVVPKWCQGGLCHISDVPFCMPVRDRAQKTCSLCMSRKKLVITKAPFLVGSLLVYTTLL